MTLRTSWATYVLLFVVTGAGAAPARPSARPVRSAASAPGTVAASVDDPPTPPAPEAIQARLAAERAWYERELVAAYRAVGKRGSAWDGPALEALEAAADAWSSDARRRGNEVESAWRAADRAVQAGATDALVRYLRARMGGQANALDAPVAARLASAAAEALDRTEYHPILRAAAHVRAAGSLIDVARGDRENQAELLADAVANLDAAQAQLVEAAPKRDVPSGFVLSLVAGYLDARHSLGRDRKVEFEPLQAAWQKSHEAKDALLPLLRARFLLDYAWDARGGGTWNKLSETGKDVFASRAAQAEQELARAVAVDPGNRGLAPLTLALELAQGRGRERMEAWFRYGTLLDPGNFDLWSAKLHYLEPRWYGSEEAMLAFGRECRDTGNPALRVPFVLVLAHFTLAEASGDNPGYFDGNAGACRDLRDAYGKLLESSPEAVYERSAWALYAYRCGDYVESDRQFKLLGNDVRVGPFLTRTVLEHTRSDAAVRSRAKTRRP